MIQTLDKLIDQVRAWGHDKGIVEQGTTIAQAVKTMEEACELLSAVNIDDPMEIRDGIGDTLVTLILQAEMQGLSLYDCLHYAYQQIAAREGRMMNGQFIKDE